MRAALLLLVSASLISGCSGQAAPSSSAPSSQAPAPQGPRSPAQLREMLLQPEDAPTLLSRRDAASADLTTQATPQLALCTDGQPVAPHEVANVLAKPEQMGRAQVFEVLSVFSTPAGARGAFDAAARAAQQCPSYTANGTSFTVVDVGRPEIAGAQAVLQYRLTTPDVVGGDVRTLAVSGPALVLLTGYGAPPPGQTLLGYQAAVLLKALRRLRA